MNEDECVWTATVKQGIQNFLDCNFNIPVPLQYLHLFFSCCSTLLASINIKAEITPTAPPEKDATMGSTWLIKKLNNCYLEQ